MLRVLFWVALVVGVVLWLLKLRQPAVPPPAKGSREGKGAAPPKMVACAHCGVHLPGPEASFDAEGRSYCGEAHRVAGPS